MRRSGFALSALIIIVAGMTLVAPVLASAAGPDGGTDDRENSNVHVQRNWLTRLDPGVQIPQELALRFVKTAVAHGLSKGQAFAMLNDQRFAMAVGSPDQGYGLLEAMIANPAYIEEAQELLADRSYSASGADSFQSAVMSAALPLRNAYLEDLGLMAVKGPAGVLVLVDLETGRQYIGQGRSGAQLRAPGCWPLPSPSISPEEAAAQMWAEAELSAEQLAAESPSPGAEIPPLGGRWEAPADGRIGGLYVVAALFLLAWLGYAAVAVGRRLRGPLTQVLDPGSLGIDARAETVDPRRRSAPPGRGGFPAPPPPGSRSPSRSLLPGERFQHQGPAS